MASKLNISDKLERRRHSAAHLMAWAVSNLFDDVKLDIGPPTNQGFYYDFDMPHRLTPDDLERIEKEMARLAALDDEFVYSEMSREEAEEFIASTNQPYKLERLGDIPEGEKITFYRCGDYIELCRGPHAKSTGKIGAFKLLSIAGSYYRGKETNPMLQRIYGTAFGNEKELNKYLQQIEEAEKRDHRRLGKELDLFSTDEDIGPGLILWHPKGARIRNTIEEFWKAEHYKHGYELLYTPHMGFGDLWQTSGHLDNYKETMYSPVTIDERDYYVKPMNCPFHVKIFQNHPRSYRDLPCRWAELGTVYRYEQSGALHGLLRVRGFTQDDAHIFCTPDQVEDEICEVLDFCLHILRSFGFENFKLYLATRPEKSVGEQAMWDQALESLEKAVERCGLDCEVDPGGGAFYGPKIDLKIQDALGREWQCSTIQFDFNLPQENRFDITYIGEDGQKHRPYMIHRALFGSLERFFALLVEHYAGAFPLWLAPEQVRVLPITDDQMDYGKDVVKQLKAAGIRAELDTRSEGLGGKIRRGRNDRVPYLVVVGQREAEEGTVAPRSRADGNLDAMSVGALIERLHGEIEAKS